MPRTARLALALMALGAPALADDRAPAPAQARPGLKVDHSKLSNGLDVLVVEKHGTPLVTIEVAVKTGSFTETPETNGLSHLYEHMFFKGNAALPTQAAYMARVAELGISFNGTTSTERVNYFITLPARNFAKGMEFMSDALLTPRFDMQEMVNERKVVIGEYDRNEANPEYYLHRAMREAMYGAQAYRKNPLGERDVILSATTETMKDFKARFYLPNNAALVIVGDVNPTEARVLAERLFGQRLWQSGANPHDPPREPLPRLAETRSVLIEKPTKNVVLALEWPGPDVGRDERATFVADVWGTLLDLPHGRFQRLFREQGLADRASMGYYTQREGGEINFRATVRDGKVLEVRDALLSELSAMADPSYWSPQDIALAKRNLAISRAYEAESGEDFAHTLSFWWASSSYDYYLRYLDETATVTPAELSGFVQNYILGRPLAIGCLLSPEQKAALELSPEALRPAAGGASGERVEELDLDGLRVLVRRQPGSSITALDLYLRDTCADLRPERQGVDLLLASTLLEGSQKLPRAAVQEQLVALGARTGQEATYDYARLSLVAPAQDFARALEVVSGCLREPLFDPAVVEERRSQMLSALNAEKANADNYLVRVTNAAFFAGHPYAPRPDGTLESVPGLDRAALLERWGQFGRQRLLVVLVGDLDAAAARALLQPRLAFVPPLKGGWKAPELPGFEPSGTLSHDKRELPTTYVLGKAAAPAPGSPDWPAAKLMFNLLRQRLWETLRTKHALTYAPGAGISAFRANYSYLYVSTTQPAKAVELMHQEMKRLVEEPVAASELAGMVAQEETRAWERMESAAAHANALGRAELCAGGWRQLYGEAGLLGQVTPPDVQRAAAQYLRGFTWGVIGPSAPSEAELKGESPK